MKQKPRIVLFEDMLYNARKALEFIEGVEKSSFVVDELRVYATIRAAEIVGEAAYQVSGADQAAHPAIPWREAVKMRHRLIHGYQSVDPGIVYELARKNFPPLIAELEKILKEETDQHGR